VPETYRLDPAIQYIPGEFGIPTPGYDLKTNYGDLDMVGYADLSELRVGADSGNLWLLARTTTMTDPAKTALLVLLDTAPGNEQRDVPFAAGIHSTRAEYALYLSGRRGWVADIRTGEVRPLPSGSVATDPRGYNNALEARVPRRVLGSLPARFSVAAATGTAASPDSPQLADTGLGANLANVAFRPDEPARNWWDKRQAFSLYDRTIDPFFADVELRKLTGGRNERYVPEVGYHDRIFTSDAKISSEQGLEGVLQHYGVYIPTAYDGVHDSPIQWWFHFRGGTAHIAAAAVPRIFKDMGEDQDALVVTPRGRGTSTWYVGKGHVDFQEVWADVHRTFHVDRRREYISGHSMGGWATYLMSILYPDRFAAGLPASGPVTQGAWTGIDFDGCDEFHAPGDDTTPCYVSANGGRPRDQFTRPLLENTQWTPLAIFQGSADELVFNTGVVRQAERLQELGYRYRMYQFPAQEHYGPPIVDQWAEGARYEFSFVRPVAPPRLTYIRSMPFERATEEVNSGGVPLQFDFDSSYWMSGLEPVDQQNGVARFDGHTNGVPERPHLLLPEAGGPASPDQAGPYVMVGQQWLDSGNASPWSNAFEASLTGARAVRLNVDEMRLDPGSPLSGNVSNDSLLRLELDGSWPADVTVTIDGQPAPAERSPGALAVELSPGSHQIELSPAG
jgi:Prolyl oligopeptidase family